MLRYNQVTIDFSINALFAENMSKRKRNVNCNQVFVTDFGYTNIFTVKSKGYVHHSTKHLFNNYGFPPAIIDDFSGEQIQGDAQNICEKVGCQI